MPSRVFIIQAEWDPEAECWVARSSDVPGLATGADTLEDLVDKLKIIVPELLEENGILPVVDDGFDLPFTVMAQRLERVRAGTA